LVFSAFAESANPPQMWVNALSMFYVMTKGSMNLNYSCLSGDYDLAFLFKFFPEGHYTSEILHKETPPLCKLELGRLIDLTEELLEKLTHITPNLYQRIREKIVKEVTGIILVPEVRLTLLEIMESLVTNLNEGIDYEERVSAQGAAASPGKVHGAEKKVSKRSVRTSKSVGRTRKSRK